jgi:hypothetical protein
MTTDEWTTRVARLQTVKLEIAQNDLAYPWPYHAPRRGCDAAELKLVSDTLGQPIDPALGDLLQVCNGWTEFFTGMTLFGSAEFLGDEYASAAELLEDAELGDLDPGSLYPVAASSYNINIITIDGSAGDSAGTVRWFGGYELERYDNFAAFFESVITAYEFDRDRPVEDRPY